MNNDATQSSPSQYPWQKPLNQSIANLTKAMALGESGQNGTPNYEAVGDNSTSHGAYQWQPGVFQSEAEKYGLDPSDFSPENQDKVQYSTNYDLAEKGISPENIVASHNMGPRGLIGDTWKSNVGTNQELGVEYNTPAYVNKIQQIYNKMAGSAPTQVQGGANQPAPSVPAPKPSIASSIDKWLPLILGGFGVAGITAATGGLDLPFLGAAAGAADVGGGAAAIEAAPAAAEAGGGILSSILQGAKSLAGKVAPLAEGVGLVDTAKTFLGGNNNNQQPAADNPTPTPQSSLTNQSFDQSSNASHTLSKAMESALSQTPAGRVFLQSKEAQQGLQGNAQYGLAPEVDANGNYDSAGALAKSDSMVGNLSDEIALALEAEGTHTNINDVVDEAKANMREYTPSNEWEDADAHIEHQANTYRKFADENGNISLGNVERMKKEQYRASGKWDTQTTSAKRSAHKALASGARKTILKKTEAKDLYTQAMKEEQQLINGKKVLKRLNGKKAHKDPSFGKAVAERLAQYASIAIGDKIGGPLGAVVGAVIGHKLEKKIEKKFGHAAIEHPSVKAAMEILAKKKPEVAQLIRQTIEKYDTRKEGEREYEVIKKDEKYDTEKERVGIEKEMGTYKLAKHPKTGRVGLKEENNNNKNGVRG